MRRRFLLPFLVVALVVWQAMVPPTLRLESLLGEEKKDPALLVTGGSPPKLKHPPVSSRDTVLVNSDWALQHWRALNQTGPLPEQVITLRHKSKDDVFLFKGVGPQNGNVIAKRFRCTMAQRDRLIYQEILPSAQIHAPEFRGFIAEDAGAFCWLFIEEVVGEQYASDSTRHNCVVAKWLGHMHTKTQHMALARTFPAQDADLYLKHLRDGRKRISQNMDHAALNATDHMTLGKILSHLSYVESLWPEVENSIQLAPSTLVHGDYKGSNFRIKQNAETPDDVLVFDWETVGWGYPGADLWMRNLDLNVYRDTVAAKWPTVTYDNVTRMMRTGKLLRKLAAVDWASSWFETDYPQKIVKEMREHEEWFRDGLSSLFVDS